jgi:7,8-dihydropterin-6-yl-methyl-4-(beta-D-ribofuranosyl)aminobenzene 5'-phosphate synthase
MSVAIKEVDKVEILTLQDNFIDLVNRDDNEVIRRAMPLKGLEFRNSITAEHGFSALVTLTDAGESRTMLFDFGLSEDGAVRNAEALGADLTKVEVLALSHGHPDHTLGLEALVKKIGKPGLELVAHPEAFRDPRFLKITEDFRVSFPPLTRERLAAAGLRLVETSEPYPLLDGRLLFLGQVPRTTDYEKGAPNLWFGAKGQERQDTFDDDTALVAHVKGQGLVVLSGCAHSGIVNTVRQAMKVTGVDRVMAVMGGFHLGGPNMEPVVSATTAALKEIKPRYLVPTHCTGRKAVNYMEQQMPDSFIMNMSGTQLTFAA